MPGTALRASCVQSHSHHRAAGGKPRLGLLSRPRLDREQVTEGQIRMMD